MLPNIKEEFESFMKSKVGGPRLQNNLRASSLGFACDRHHYYSLTESKPSPDWKLQSIFREGNLHEKDVEGLIREMGFEVQGMQSDFRLENPLITARIDGELRKNSPWYPFDTKTISPWGFDSINSAEDILFHKQTYVRNYATQILIYMLIKSAEFGCLIFKNKQTGELKDIWFSFEQHVSVLDESIKRAERVYKSVADKNPPERTTDRSLCAKCDFKDICLPDLLANGGIQFLDSDDLAAKLSRRESLIESKDEFEDLDAEIKETVKQTGVGEKAIGDFLINIKEVKTMRKKPITWTDEENSYLKVGITKI